MLGKNRGTRLLATGLATVSLLAIVPDFAMGQNGSGAPQSTETCALSGPVLSEFAKLPANATLEDYEGATLFAVSQVSCSNEAAIAALESLAGTPSLSAVQRQAILNVAEALKRRTLRRGTGAINGGGDGFGNSAFGSPVVGVGGGSSNYTS